jgi:GNAT superfamily N-acetyltransferase
MSDIILEKSGLGTPGHCGVGCISNPRNPGCQRKIDWLQKRFSEGLQILLLRTSEGKPLGFLECVPGEFAWRPVDAKGWIFVHCLWVYPRGQKVGGLGTRLIRACVEEARSAGAIGVAAMVSNGAWMAGKEVFLKNGFLPAGEADRFQLLTHRLKHGPSPAFRRIDNNAARYQGLHVVYAPQCPFLPKSVNDISEVAAAHGLDLRVTTLTTASEAQNAPSYYGVFSLLWNGRLLADHYVSQGRFRNILRQVIFADSGLPGTRRTHRKRSRP